MSGKGRLIAIAFLVSTNASASTKFLIRASYLQIYNEMISDLLKPTRSNLSIREDNRRGDDLQLIP